MRPVIVYRPNRPTTVPVFPCTASKCRANEPSDVKPGKLKAIDQ